MKLVFGALSSFETPLLLLFEQAIGNRFALNFHACSNKQGNQSL